MYHRIIDVTFRLWPGRESAAKTARYTDENGAPYAETPTALKRAHTTGYFRHSKLEGRNKLQKSFKHDTFPVDAVRTTPKKCQRVAESALDQNTTCRLLPERNDSIPENIKRYHTTFYEPLFIGSSPLSQEAATPPSNQSVPGVEATTVTAAHLPDSTVDYMTHFRPPICHENIFPRQHTIYQVQRTRSVHFHEHYYYVQPLAKTNNDTSSSVTSFA